MAKFTFSVQHFKENISKSFSKTGNPQKNRKTRDDDHDPSLLLQSLKASASADRINEFFSKFHVFSSVSLQRKVS